MLDKKAEGEPLDANEIGLKRYLNNRLVELLGEEIKWYQRAKVKELLEGDSNTKYFQLIANNDKYRKSRIFQLQHEDKVIEGEAALKQHITRYYKKNCLDR
jgi:hypothetical protein